MIVYVTTQGARIVREGQRLLVKKDTDTYHTLFIHKLEQLILVGHVAITPQALRLLLRENVDTVFLRMDGRYLGRLAGGEMKNVFLRKRQFQLTDDEDFCLAMARSIVTGKMANMATVLQRIARTRHSRPAREAAEAIREKIEQLADAESLDAVRGFEGSASARHFAGLRHGLDKDYGFSKRVRRPPTDPVNAVLSLLSTFLINRAYAAVRIAGLDPYPGMLHALEYGRYSLPLDLVEEFRPIIVDTLTLSLFNLGILKETDFYTIEHQTPLSPLDASEDSIDAICTDPIGQMTLLDDEEDDIFDIPPQPMVDEIHLENINGKKPSVRLYPNAFNRVLKAFEKKMNMEFYHPLAAKKMTYAESIIFQARQMRKVIEGESSKYHPLLLK